MLKGKLITNLNKGGRILIHKELRSKMNSEGEITYKYQEDSFNTEKSPTNS